MSTESEMITCPTCEKPFDGDNLQGMKIHHSRSHGERLVDHTTCNYCGEEFEIPYGQERRFCSRECSGKHQSETVEKVSLTCKNCEEEFMMLPSRADRYQFCSDDCRTAYNRVTLECEGCGEKYERPRSEKDRSRFCSRECQARQRGKANKKEPVPVECDGCGDVVECIPSQAKRRRYCSRECYAAARVGQDLPGLQSPSPRVDTECKVCGTPMQATPYEIDDGRKQYCSLACHNEDRKQRVEVECGVCYQPMEATEFERDYGRKKYCSVRCRSIAQTRRQLGRQNQYHPRPRHGEKGLRKLVERCYFQEGHSLDATVRIVRRRLEDGEQWSHEDIEEFVNDQLGANRKMEQRLLAVRPEDIGLSPIGEAPSRKTVTDGGVDQ